MYEYTNVELVGIGSDSDGSISSYAWAQLTGPTAVFGETNSPVLDVVAPDVSAATELLFTLTVTDDDGATATDEVAISVQPLQEVSGVLAADTLLDGSYAVTDDLQVPVDVTLTILPGTVLRFARGTGMVVAGSLLANGTVAEPIFFSYLQLAQNLDLSWNGIRFVDSTNSSISNSVIENAAVAVSLDGTSIVPVSGNVFRNNRTGLTDSYGYHTVQITGNSFTSNFQAIAGIRTNGSSEITANLFEDNPEVLSNSYYFDTTTVSGNSFEGATLVIDGPANCCGHGVVTATDNWWSATDTAVIDALIVDSSDDVTLQKIEYVPILSEKPASVGSQIPVDILVPGL